MPWAAKHPARQIGKQSLPGEQGPPHFTGPPARRASPQLPASAHVAQRVPVTPGAARRGLQRAGNTESPRRGTPRPGPAPGPAPTGPRPGAPVGPAGYRKRWVQRSKTLHLAASSSTTRSFVPSLMSSRLYPPLESLVPRLPGTPRATSEKARGALQPRSRRRPECWQGRRARPPVRIGAARSSLAVCAAAGRSGLRGPSVARAPRPRRRGRGGGEPKVAGSRVAGPPRGAEGWRCGCSLPPSLDRAPGPTWGLPPPGLPGVTTCLQGVCDE